MDHKSLSNDELDHGQTHVRVFEDSFMFGYCSVVPGHEHKFSFEFFIAPGWYSDDISEL